MAVPKATPADHSSPTGRTPRLLIAALAALLAGPAGATPEFDAVWRQGKAEITSYDLEQARYGEIHPGHAVLIFVTEDLSRERQVKLDRPEAAGDDRVPVLKLNSTREFTTGIYPYSVMTSVFSSVDPADGGTLKVTTSSQEWCGHTFVQLNREARGWRLAARSYFESEGDVDLDLPAVPLEDDVWTRIRLDPRSLPVGELEMLPGTMTVRLLHLPWAPQRALAALQEDGDFRIYTLEYPELARRLAIRFRAAFPHEIVGWEDTIPAGRGPGAATLTTRATERKRKSIDYWNHNSLADRGLRATLGLD